MNEDGEKDRIVKKLQDSYSSSIVENPDTSEKMQAQTEFLSASIDALQFAAGGELWNKTSVLATIPPSEESFPYGTNVSFVPDPESSDDNWRGTFVLTQSSSDPNITASVFINGELTKDGNKVTAGKFRSDYMNSDEILTAVGILAVTVASSKE
jgi:hypothetical protein